MSTTSEFLSFLLVNRGYGCGYEQIHYFLLFSNLYKFPGENEAFEMPVHVPEIFKTIFVYLEVKRITV